MPRFSALFLSFILSGVTLAKLPLLEGTFRGKFPGATAESEVEFVLLATNSGTSSRIRNCNFISECQSGIRAVDNCATKPGKCDFLVNLAMSRIDYLPEDMPWDVDYKVINGIGLIMPTPAFNIRSESDGATGLLIRLPGAVEPTLFQKTSIRPE